MLNWKAQSKIGDTKKAINALDHESTDIGLVQDGDEHTFEDRKLALIAANKTMNGEIDITVAKRSKIMALMCENTNNTHY